MRLSIRRDDHSFTGDNATLTKELSLCHPPSNSSADLATFSSFLISSYVTMSQFNGLPPSVFFNVSGNSLDVAVNDTLASPTPLAGINQTLWHAHGLDAVGGCLNFPDAQSSNYQNYLQGNPGTPTSVPSGPSSTTTTTTTGPTASVSI